jgi:hypothetical protein
VQKNYEAQNGMLDFDRWFMQSSAFKFENQEM